MSEVPLEGAVFGCGERHTPFASFAEDNRVGVCQLMSDGGCGPPRNWFRGGLVFEARRLLYHSA